MLGILEIVITNACFVVDIHECHFIRSQCEYKSNCINNKNNKQF